MRLVCSSKYALLGVVFVPLLVYTVLPLLSRAKAQPRDYRPLGTGVALVLSAILCIWLLAGIPAA